MFTSLLNLFFPPICAGCESILLQNESVICTDCRHEIALTQHHLHHENEAFQKFYGKIPIEFAICLMYYHKRGVVQEMIRKLKYEGHEEVGIAIGHWLCADLKNVNFIKEIDFIIPVPLHVRKLRERGYNQVTEFGKTLSENLALPFDSSILVRNSYSKTQTKKNLLGRIEVHKSLFDVNFTTEHYGKHFLLIDDVLTTGSTLEACGRALLKIPGAKISIVCMAMTHS